jgi:hypothetical protein
MSKSVSFNIGEEFTQAGKFCVPKFKTVNKFRIKQHEGSLMIYITQVVSLHTYIVRDEVFDFISSQFNTIREVVEWMDLHHGHIFMYYGASVQCNSMDLVMFEHNGVEHTSSLGSCCRRCQDNSLLRLLKDLFHQDFETVDIERNVEVFQSTERYDKYWFDFNGGSITVWHDDWNIYRDVPDDVARLLFGLDAKLIHDIVMEVGCYREMDLTIRHTSYGCQCDNCYSEEMVERVEEVLARMT